MIQIRLRLYLIFQKSYYMVTSCGTLFSCSFTLPPKTVMTTHSMAMYVYMMQCVLYSGYEYLTDNKFIINISPLIGILLDYYYSRKVLLYYYMNGYLK